MGVSFLLKLSGIEVSKNNVSLPQQASRKFSVVAGVEVSPAQSAEGVSFLRPPPTPRTTREWEGGEGRSGGMANKP